MLKPVDPPARAPDVTFTGSDGAGHRLSQFRAQGLVVNLWATWCPPCVAELPALSRLAGMVAADHVKVLAIADDRGGAPVVEAFYKTHQIENLPVLIDREGALMRAFKARGIPSTYVIDRAGFERAYAEGGVNWVAPPIVAKIRELTGTSE